MTDFDLTDATRIINRKVGSDQDRRGIAFLAYVKTMQEFDPSRGKASTFFYQAMQNALNDQWRKERKHADLLPLENDSILPSHDPSPERQARFSQFVERLSNDGRSVLAALFGGSESKQALIRTLRKKGWAHKRISTAFVEIRHGMEVAL